jgi:hypothetical protein
MSRWRSMSRGRRRALVAVTVVGVLGVLAVIGLVVVYPRVGEWMIRDKMVPRLEAKLGRKVEIGDISISLGHATLHDVVVRGPADGDKPFARVNQVDIEFAVLKSFVGTAKIEDVVADKVVVALRRGTGGDNFTDLAIRFGLRKPADGTAASPGTSFGSLRPDKLKLRHIAASMVDEASGTRVEVADGDAELTRDNKARARLAKIAITTTAGPGGSLGSIAVERAPGVAPVLTVLDGEIRLWPRLALTGISGMIAPSGDEGRYELDLAGGYGGVEGTLWTAQGWIDPAAGTGAIDATADEFTLDRLAPILERSPVKDFAATKFDARLHVVLSR